MSTKKIYRLKIACFIGFSLLVAYIIINNSEDEVKKIPVSVKIIINDKLVKPVKNVLSKRDSIVSFGMSLIGKPYVYGACSKDAFDCSGFVFYVFQHFKIEVPRSSAQFKDFGKEIDIEGVKKGDILVFLSPTRSEIGHVGIVTYPNGRESEFIHASSGREMKVIKSSLKQEGYKRRFVKAVDVLNKMN